MTHLKVAFSKKYDFDFGTRYQTKLVAEVDDPLFGTQRKTYYLWGTKQFEEDQELKLELDDFVIERKEGVVDGKDMVFNNIVARK